LLRVINILTCDHPMLRLTGTFALQDRLTDSPWVGKSAHTADAAIARCHSPLRDLDRNFHDTTPARAAFEFGGALPGGSFTNGFAAP